MLFAVSTIAAFTCSGVQDGCAWSTSAAVPDVIGHDIEVPDMRVPSLPVPIAVDCTLTPGAVTSGFGAESTLRGPPDENDAREP